MQLSAHFTLEEFEHSQIAERIGIDNHAPIGIIDRLRMTAVQLEAVRGTLGGRPIFIDSGYRCRDLNAVVGGARDSAHMHGFAVDFVCPMSGKPLAICQWLALDPMLKYDQLIYEFTWVHLSFAPAMRQQTLIKRRDGVFQCGPDFIV